MHSGRKMKKQFIIFGLILITSSIVSYYYGVSRGAQAATNTFTLNIGTKAIEAMDLHSAVLLSIKNADPALTLKFAKSLVEHDIQHLDKLETMLIETPSDEVSKTVFKLAITRARETHKLLQD
jgi:hypothetical protein